MANKASVGVKSKMPEGKVNIKWVKRAQMWCKTWFQYDQERGTAKQMQEWTAEKPK